MKTAMRNVLPGVIGFIAFALQGATLTVAPSGGDYATLEAAVAAAADGDEIVIENGTYTRTGTAIFEIAKGVAIRSRNGREGVAIVGSGTGARSGFRLNHADASIAGVTFRSYYSTTTSTGLAIVLEVAAGVVSDCAVSNCTASSGTAVKVSGGTLRRTIVSNCYQNYGGTDRRGAGVFVTAGRVEDCEIFGNSGNVGVALSLEGDNAVATGCSIHGNYGHGQIVNDRGLVWNSYGTVYVAKGLLENSRVFSNTNCFVAGVYLAGGAASGCKVYGNYAYFDKVGGVYVKSGTITDTDIMLNGAATEIGSELTMAGGTATGLNVFHGWAPPCASFVSLSGSASLTGSALPVATAGNSAFDPSAYDFAAMEAFGAPDGTTLSVRAVADAYAGLAPLAVDFSSAVAGAANPAFSWDFGDGATSSAANPGEHVFASPGLYTVTLSVADGGDTAVSTLKVYAGSPVAYADPAGGDVYPYDTPAKAAVSIQDAIGAVYADDAVQGTVHLAGKTFSWLSGARKDILSPMVVVGRNVRLAGPEGGFAVVDSQAKRQGMLVHHPSSRVERVWLGNGRFEINRMFHSANLVMLSGLFTDGVVSNGFASYSGNASVLGGTLRRSVVTKGSLSVSGVDRPAGGVNVANTGVVEDCDIVDNYGGYGAGVFICGSSSAVVSNCLIRENYGSSMGGAGATLVSGLLTCSTIVSNTSPKAAGGVLVRGGTLRNCVVAFNKANGGSAGLNTNGGGGGIGLMSGNVQNCTVYGNAAASSPAGHGLYMTGGTAVNTIVYGNRLGEREIEKTGGTIGHCAVSAADDGLAASNVAGDPGLANPNAGDFRLLYGAPAIDAGETVAAVGGDIAGTPRPVGAAFDIGAYEMDFSGQIACSFSADAVTGCDSLSATLTAQAAGGTEPYRYAWTIGGVTTETASPAFPFTVGYGRHDVTLTVTDAGGRSATVTRVGYLEVKGSTAYVSETGDNVWPYASWEHAARVPQDAIDAVYHDARTDGVVYVADGTYTARSASDLYAVNIAVPVRLVGTNATCKAVLTGNAVQGLRAANLGHPRAFVAGIAFDNFKEGLLGSGLSSGVWLYDGTVSNCVLSRCNSTTAGGFTLYGGLVTDCVVTNCDGGTHSGGDRHGGGASLLGAATLRRTLVTKCRAGHGGGVYVNHSNAVVQDCTLQDNTTTAGGTICLKAGLVERCVVRRCTVGGTSTGDADCFGGGAYVTGSGSTLRNCLLVGNTSKNKTATGTGLYVTSSGRAYNNTVWASAGNTAAVTNDAVNAGGTLANTAAGTLSTSSGTSVGNAVVGADAFKDAAAGDFRPRRTSALFNAGDSSFWGGEPAAVDFAGNRRVRNGRVDAGAYEFGDLPTLLGLH